MVKKIKKTYTKYNPSTDHLEYTFHYNDAETTILQEKLNKNSQVGIDDLRRIALWKIDRVLNVPDDTIAKLGNLAAKQDLTVEDEIVKDVIQDLLNADGIGFPMASAILKFLRPDVFPIIDVRAYRAFTGTKPNYSTYTYEKYIEYAKELSADAKKRNRALRDMDEQLYRFDQEKNGKI